MSLFFMEIENINNINMKNNTFFLSSKFLFLVVTFLLVGTSLFAQKNFTKREPQAGSTTLFTNGVYRLHGNFTMLGNTLMKRNGYNGVGGAGDVVPALWIG